MREDGVVQGYEEDLAAIHASAFDALAVAGARELLGRLRRPSRVVELGCGDGTTARLLTDAGHDVLGIDASRAFVALACQHAPRATFRVASFVDFELPRGYDAVLAIGEVLSYRLDERNDHLALDSVFSRAAQALRPGGLFLFDLPGPNRVLTAGHCAWQAGKGWALLVEAASEEEELRRRIITFREVRAGCFRRSEETHRLTLHSPSDVLRRLRAAGFAARALRHGYANERLPRGLTAYNARKR
jgi:SAM-dependent methyltransferase